MHSINLAWKVVGAALHVEGVTCPTRPLQDPGVTLA